MVQRKVAQNAKAKTVPATNTKSGKPAKTETLSNGYEKSKNPKSKQNPKLKAAEEADHAEAESVGKEQEKLNDVEIKTENISTVSDSTEQTKAGSSKSNTEGESKEDTDSEIPDEKKELEKAPETVSESKNTRKRKLPDPKSDDSTQQTKAGTSKSNSASESKEKTDSEIPDKKMKQEKAPETVIESKKSSKRKLPGPKTEHKAGTTKSKTESQTAVKKVTTAKNRTKAKRQKIVLEVPSLKSIPGKLFVVGENDVGQIGLDEDVDSKAKPFLLDLPYSIVDIAAGGMHSVCLTENGEVITFGCNDEGALGRTASEEEERIPRKVDIPERIVQVSAGDSHSAALAESGQVYLWGNFRNGEGQMGLTADGNKRIAPLKVLSDKTVVKIASGGDHLACLTKDGIVFTCGCGEQGQLGRINPRVCRDGGRKGLACLLEPAPVDRLASRTPVNDVWTESYATFLKAQDTGSIYAFGLNNYSQLGFENRSNEQQEQMIFFPETISSFNNRSWQQINGGQHHTLALDNDGIVHSLGRKDYGRLGLSEDCEDKSAPTVVPTLQKEKCNSVSCGNCVSFAVTQNGTLYSWGMGSSQLGHGGDEDIHVPQLIKGDLLNSWEVYKVSGGGQHALILACPKKSSTKKKEA